MESSYEGFRLRGPAIQSRSDGLFVLGACRPAPPMRKLRNTVRELIITATLASLTNQKLAQTGSILPGEVARLERTIAITAMVSERQRNATSAAFCVGFNNERRIIIIGIETTASISNSSENPSSGG